MPTLPINAIARQAHDAELLVEVGRLQPMSLRRIFDGLPPRWAMESLGRLIHAGLVCVHDDEALTLTTAGQAKLAQPRKVWPMPTTE